MTTGRINQVTIVNPSAEANEQTPRRRPWCTGRKGEAEATPSRKHQECARHPSHERPIQLPPLSSPSCGPRRVAFGYYTVYYTVTCAPQEERTRAKSTRKRGYLTEPSPKIWWNVWQSQRSTDPKCCPLIERPAGLQFPPQARCSHPKVTNTAQAGKSRRAPRRHANQSKHSVPLHGKQGLLVRYRGRSPKLQAVTTQNSSPKAGELGKVAAKAARMLTAAA
jgi:hypothetical protein